MGLFSSLGELLSSSAFMGGLWLAILGAVGGTVVYAASKLVDLFSRYFIVRASVANTEDAFEWLVVWLANQKTVLSSKKLKLTTKKDDRHTVHRAGDGDSSGKMQLLPGNGTHLFSFKGKLIWMMRSQGKRVTTGWEQTPFEFETIYLSTYSRSADIFKDLFSTAKAYAESINADKTRIFTLSPGAYRWLCAMAKPPRPLDSVILDTNVADELVADVQDFFQRKKWYEDRGIPYRRGYLLHGPPGCGKTSFCQALAGRLGLTICVLTLSDQRLSDASLNVRLHETPERSIILLEDVDAIFVERETASSRMQLGVTFSGLLNALDGVASQENRLLFMTTNHIERLDAALIRPGRCDVHVKFDYASPAQMRGLFCKFFPDLTNEADLFAQRLAGTQLPMAALQGYLMKRRDSYEDALNDTEQLFGEQRSSSGASGSMDIGVWLTRLGLEEYYDGFAHAKVFTVQDIPDNLKSLGVKLVGHQKRIKAMLSGRADVKEQFGFVSASQAESLFLQCFSTDSNEGTELVSLARSFADQIPVHTVSGAQVLKHCAQHQGDPATAATPLAVTGLINRCRRKFGRGSEGNTAMLLVDVSGARQYDGMPLAAWFRRLGLEHHTAAAQAQGLCLVSDLRHCKDNLASMGIKVAAELDLVKDMLDGKRHAVDAFQLITTEAAAMKAFMEIFPESSAATAKAFAAGIVGTPGPGVSVAQAHAFCRHHRSFDLLGVPRIDTTGKRAVSCCLDLVQGQDLPTSISRLLPLCKRLGLSATLVKKFEAARVFEVADLKQGDDIMPANDLMDTFDLRSVAVDVLTLSKALALDPVGVARFAIANHRDHVAVAFDAVYGTGDAVAEARRAFLSGVPVGKFSVGQLLAHCQHHSAAWNAGGEAPDGDDAADDATPVERDDTGAACVRSLPTLLDPAAATAGTKPAGAVGGEAKGVEENAHDAGGDSDEEVDIRPWLDSLGLAKYTDTLIEEGFDDATLLKHVTDDELKDIGIAHMGVRVRLLAAVKKLP